MTTGAIAILNLAIAAACACADDAIVPMAQVGDPVTLSFDALYEPTQPNWRVSLADDAPVLIDSAKIADQYFIGFLWIDDALAASDLDLWLVENSSVIDQLGLVVGRSTALRDGGIDGIGSSLGEEGIAGYAEGSGEFDLYDISVSVGSLGTERMGVDLITGLRAVKANVGHAHREQSANGATHTTLDVGRGVVAIPIVGTGLHWQPRDHVRLTGTASTHTISEQATFYDLTAEAEIKLRPNVGLVAGYQYVRSVMEVRNVPAELNEGGVFARIRIQF